MRFAIHVLFVAISFFVDVLLLLYDVLLLLYCYFCICILLKINELQMRFFRTRLIQDNNLGQGYGILVPKWLKKLPKTILSEKEQ